MQLFSLKVSEQITKEESLHFVVLKYTWCQKAVKLYNKLNSLCWFGVTPCRAIWRQTWLSCDRCEASAQSREPADTSRLRYARRVETGFIQSSSKSFREVNPVLPRSDCTVKHTVLCGRKRFTVQEVRNGSQTEVENCRLTVDSRQNMLKEQVQRL